MPEKKISIKDTLYPLVIVIIVLIPIFESALQIELLTNEKIPIHWRLFIGAAIGGLLSGIVQIFKRAWNIREEDLNTAIAERDAQITNLALQHRLTEREIMINALLLNDKWNRENLEIKNLTDLENALITKVEAKDPSPSELPEKFE